VQAARLLGARVRPQPLARRTTSNGLSGRTQALAIAAGRLDTLRTMRKIPWSPERLDVEAFAKAGARIEQTLALESLPRLRDGLTRPVDAAGDEAIFWSAAGTWGRVSGDAVARARIHLQAHPRVWLTCQRCLQPVAVTLQVDRTLCFVDGEDEAARLDEDREDEDVIALSRALDLRELLEDELIMALPLVPRHETCPQPLAWTGAVEPGEEDAPEQAHPFAALAALKAKA
jgi:uncharacterized protein